jgi:outer membrane protein OmpA-like peptidoglycan-associated protein
MGYGSERPLVSNDDEDEGRAINRRTEIEIIGDH